MRPCPVCGAVDSEPGYLLQDRLFQIASGEFAYRRCRDCASLFLSPLPSESQVAGFYRENYWWHAENPSRLQRWEGWYRSRVIRDHGRFLRGVPRITAGRPAELIDIGCGSGSFLREARRQGFSVTGMDSSATALRCLQEIGIRGIPAPPVRPLGGEKQFDVLTLFHVLEHLRDPKAEMKNLLTLARRGAWVIVQVPLLDSWQSRWFGAGWYGLDPPRHLTQFTYRGLCQFFTGLGLHIEKVWHFSLRDNAPAIVSSLFPRMDPMARQVAGRSAGRVREGFLRVLYLAMVIAATPLAALEAAGKRGGTIILRMRVS